MVTEQDKQEQPKKSERRNKKRVCSRCGREFTSDELAVKRIQFNDMGSGAKTLRSRVVAWLCRETCLTADPDWNREPWGESPGFEGTAVDPHRDQQDAPLP